MDGISQARFRACLVRRTASGSLRAISRASAAVSSSVAFAAEGLQVHRFYFEVSSRNQADLPCV
jgi:hypothetical protein